jgi:hypothetical protein
LAKMAEEEREVAYRAQAVWRGTQHPYDMD